MSNDEVIEVVDEARKRVEWATERAHKEGRKLTPAEEIAAAQTLATAALALAINRLAEQAAS